MGALNPRGVNVVSFAAPTEIERQHDFLWRVHQHTPRAGEFSIFNRSHYEDIVAVRVRNLAPEKQWKARYDYINAFESMLADEGTIVLKFFLHISKQEQEGRLLERELDPEKFWKLSVDDWLDRKRWDDYSRAYRAVFRRCAQKHAPWYIVPADAKWYRNMAVAQALVETLRPYRKGWRKVLEARGERLKKELGKLHDHEPERRRRPVKAS
jgi:PPK2 family polyphosphate:nucleotide phosphotransferase